MWQMYHSRWAHALRYSTVALYLCISLFETPGWCLRADGRLVAACAHADSYAAYETFEWLRLPPAAATALEALCVALFALQMGAKLYIMGGRRFARACWPLLQVSLLLFAALDIACTASPLLWRRTAFTRPLRVLFIVCSHRKLRDTSAAVVLMLPSLLEFVALLLALLLFSAWVGYLLFGTWEGAANFGTFGASFYSMAMLLTSTNFPDVAMPTYNASRASMLFFILFQLSCVFIGLNLMLALVFRAYSARMLREAAALARNRHRALAAAFAQLTNSPLPGLSRQTLSFTHFSPLLSRLRPDLQPWQIGTCFEALDTHSRGCLELNEFEGVLHALRVHFETAPPRAHVRRHALRLKLRALASDWRTTLALDGAVVINAIVIAAQPAAAADSVCGVGIGVQLPFILLWLTETAAKLCAFGFLLVGWNAFDAVLSLAALLCLSLVIARGCDRDAETLQALHAVLLLRLLRLLRLLALSSRFRLLLRVLRVMRTPFLTFFGLLLAHMFLWASVGLEVLGGVWHRGAECLAGTRFDESDYYANNFNDMPSALVTCWELICLNNYQVFMNAGFACVGILPTSLFFGGFYLMIVFLVMNLFTSFVLDAVTSAFDHAGVAMGGGELCGVSVGGVGGVGGMDSLGTGWNLASTPAEIDEAAADDAERFAAACEKRLQAEGNSSAVSVFPQQSDGYAALVRLLAKQTVPDFRRRSAAVLPSWSGHVSEVQGSSGYSAAPPLVVSRCAFTQEREEAADHA